MLNITMRRKLQIPGILLVLLVLLTTMTALAATKLIKAGPGGTIDMAEGVELRIEPHSIEEDTVITADLLWPDKKNAPIEFNLLPDDIIFSRPAKLIIDMDVIEAMGVTELTLYGPDDEPIEPTIKGNSGVVYPIWHFSIYYYRRR